MILQILFLRKKLTFFATRPVPFLVVARVDSVRKLHSMKGERCAERPGTGMLFLWLHEYYLVVEKYNGGVPKPYVYQALEFRRGCD